MNNLVIARIVLASILILGVIGFIWYVRRELRKLDEEEKREEDTDYFSQHIVIAFPQGLQKDGCIFTQEESPREGLGRLH